MKNTLRLCFAITAMALIPVELLCAQSGTETQGEVLQGLLSMLVGLNVICLAIAWWLPRAALVGSLVIFTLVVPYQIILLNRLARINNEVTRFVHERLQLRAGGKPLPSTIDDYTFKDPLLRQYFYSYVVSEDGSDFTLYYFVVQPGITHWYDSKHGWGYYPD